MADPNVLPNLTARDVVDLAWDRLTETYILDVRTNRIGNQETLTWKTGLRENQQLYRGEWFFLDPGENGKRDLPKISNMLQAGTDDLARLASEVVADIFCPPQSARSTDIASARMRQAIALTHWKKGRGEQLKPWLVQDMALAGGCFLAAIHPESKKGYPVPFRIDPAGCYPDIINGELQDLAVMQRIRRRQAEMLTGIDLGSWAGDTDDIEVVDYYHRAGLIRVLTRVASDSPIGEPLVAQKIRYDLDRVPVAFYMNPSGDGRFHGLFDQIKGILKTQNRIASLMLDYADQGVYAPWFEFGVQNSTEIAGPRTIYHGIDERSTMKRVEPAVSSPQLYQMLEFLEMQARSGGAQPQSRSGQVDQSIASGSFVSSTQGALTSLVRSVQRGLAQVQQDWHAVAFQLDEKFGNVEKALWRPVNGQYTYKPKRDIAGYYEMEVSYGAGAGLDYLNRKAAIMQEVGAELISKDTARGQMDDIVDPEAERQKIEREQVETAYLQKAVNEEDSSSLAKVVALMSKGKTLFEAIGQVAEEAAQAQQQAQQAAQAAVPEEAPMGAAGPAAPPAGPGAAPAGPPPFVPSQPLTSIRVGP